MSTAVKRACDACHRRKVKCDGINPCRNCNSSQLGCTYLAVPQKKGPKGSRAKVISELREKQHITNLATRIQGRVTGNNGQPSPSASLAPTPGLLTIELSRACINYFFENMYPSMPILHRGRLEQQFQYMDQNMDAYCLVTSLAALMLLQPGMQLPTIPGEPYSCDMMNGSNMIAATLLLEETVRVRKTYDVLDSTSFNTLCTTYFLFAHYHALEFHDKAWFYLREAATMAVIGGMNKEETYNQYDAVEGAGRRRLYWLLFVNERTYALRRQRPMTLQASISLPTATDDPADLLSPQLGNFLQLVNLFLPFDDQFLGLWNKAIGAFPEGYVSTMKKELDTALPAYLNSPDTQYAELPNSQQWLRNMQYQINHAAGGPFQDHLLPMVNTFPGDLGLLGLNLIEKMCDLTADLAGYLAMQPASRNPFSPGPRESLHGMLNVISVLRNGNHDFFPCLLKTVHDVLPRLAEPKLLDAPLKSVENPCHIVDMFDGFGNAGIAQPAMFHNEDYDNKLAIPRFEELSNDSGSPNGMARNDVTSPFASSPGMMSPGVEMAHGLPTAFNPIPDNMVISPMAGSSTTSLHTQGSLDGHYTQQRQQSHQQPHGQVMTVQQHPQQHQHFSQQQHTQQHQHQHQHQHQQHRSNSSFHSPNNQLNFMHAPNPGITDQGLSQGMALSHGLPNMSNGVNRGMDSGMGGLTNPLGPSMNTSNMMARPVPQRASSFAMPTPMATPPMATPQIRTVGDFHALQRANSEMNVTSPLGAHMGSEMDFNTLPR